MKTAHLPPCQLSTSLFFCFFLGFLVSLAHPVFSQEFQRDYGTALDNSFSKVVQDASGNYYVLGQDEAVNAALQRATVTRLDANGIHQWTLSLDFASIWHDAVLTPSGELMVVGQTLPSDPASKGIMGRVTAAGAFARLRTYDEAGRDIFTRIVRKTGNFPYYVIGAQFEPGGTPTTEDVVLFNMDQDLNFNWKKKYFIAGDDEFFRDMESLNANELLMAGNIANGVIFKTDNNGNMLAGVQVANRFYRDVATELLGGFYAAATDFSNNEAYVQKFDASLLLQWEVKIQGLSTIGQVWEGLPGSGEIYATGAGVFGNQQRTVVVKMFDNGAGPVVVWVKYLHTGSGFIGGSSWFLPSAQIAFTDARAVPNGFGQSCAFISVSDPDMGTCEVTTTFTDLLFTDPVPDSPVLFVPEMQTPTTGVNSTEASALDWQQQEVCSTAPCSVNIVVTPMVPPCGQVQVCAVATGPGPYSYQWCNGSTSQCYTTQLTPCTPHEFCVSVTCADGTVASDTEIYTVSDNVPPVALCLGVGVVLDPIICMAPITPSLVDGGSTDNCGIASMSVNPATVTGCGLHPVTLTVVDFCGNMSTCSTSVQAIEVMPPVIVCPPSAIKNCHFNTGPGFCGFATATDNCDPSPTINFSDAITGILPCDGNIQRTWTAEDDCGNISTCIQNITIIDNVAPTIVCPQGYSTECNVNVGPNVTGFATASDNCTPPGNITITSTDLLFSDLVPFGFCDNYIERTWKATDECGNMATCVQVINVHDDVDPVLSNCPQNQTLTGTIGPNGLCSANVTVPSPSITDNCDATPTLSNSFNGTANASGIYPSGTTTVTWTGVDDCGNVATCSFVVTVNCAAGPCPNNLVPNPSFESFTSCPTAPFQLPAISWTSPTAASPDYYNACAAPTSGVSVPSNDFGNQAANTGVGYVGIIVRPVNIYREYIEAPLTAPLVAGHAYKVSFYVNHADQSQWAVDKFGAYLSVGTVGQVPLAPVLPYSPQIFNTAGYLTDKANWTLISGIYIATGGEDHIVIGNFSDNSSTTPLMGLGGLYPTSYYYVDDVEVCEICSTPPCYTCCSDYNLFCYSVQNAANISVDNNLCKATLNIGDFGGCDDYIEWIDWGDQTGQVQGPFTTGSMPMHVYSGSGTYSVCYLAIERDTNGLICFEKLVCDTITVECDTCTCLGFQNLGFIDAANHIPVTCNNQPPVQLSCPADSTGTFFFHGDLLCSSANCNASVNWQIPGTSLSGSAPAIGGGGGIYHFDLPYIAFSSFPAPGSYQLVLNGNCNGSSCGQCVINFVVPDCCECAEPDNLSFTSDDGMNILYDIPATCGDSMPIVLPCPAFPNQTFTFHGDAHCNPESCLSSGYDWSVNDLTPPGTGLFGGSGTFGFGGHFDIPIAYSQLTPGVLYQVVITYFCGDKECTCAVEFMIEDCDTCCINFDAFAQAVDAATTITVDPDLCKVTLNIGDLPCDDYIEWVNWGDGGQSGGPFPGGSMPMHTYTSSGTYTISYLAIERDPSTGLICFEKVFTETITVDCGCNCGDFTSMFFRTNQGAPSIPATCGGPPITNLGCPQPGNSFSFTGLFQCDGDDCLNLAQVNWTLTGPGGTFSGTTTANPYFGIALLPTYFTQPGLYTLTLNGQCGNQTCPCVIQFFVDCPNLCPCTPADVQALQAAVNQGFSVVKYPTSCKACFAPVALSDCEEVVWHLNSASGPVIGTSVGNNGICHTFPGAGTYTVVMVVTRLKPDGTLCEVFVHSKTITISCLILEECTDSDFPNPTFAEGAIGGGMLSGGASAGWGAVSGEPIVVEGEPGSFDGWTIELSGNFDTSDVLGTLEQVCLEKSTGTITMIAKADARRWPCCRVIEANLQAQRVFASIPLPVFDSSVWVEIEIPFDLSQWTDLEICNSTEGGVWVQPAFYVVNTLGNNQGGEDTYSRLLLDNICIDGMPLTVVRNPTGGQSIRLYPNPTSGRLILEFSGAMPKSGAVQILDLYGRLLVTETLLPGEQSHSLSIAALSAGMYFIRVTDDGIPVWTRKVVKQ